MTPMESVPSLLKTLRLPSIARDWHRTAETADREGWPAARFLAALLDMEVTERTQRRIQRHHAEAALPAGKSFATFDFMAAKGLRRGQIMALADGGQWLTDGANILIFGSSGTGKSHLAAALGKSLVDLGWRVLFRRTADLVQKLQQAKRELGLAASLDKLDKYDLVILDDVSYVRRDQAETSVLFELIAHRYERRSLMITANQPFSAWNEVFPDAAMTVAAVDRLVHHATILELTGTSYRRRAAEKRTAISDEPVSHESDTEGKIGNCRPTTTITSP